jgi:hypothetical protein
MATFRDIKGFIFDSLTRAGADIPDCEFNCEECVKLFECNVVLEFHEFWDILTAQHIAGYGEVGGRPN